MHAFLLHKQGDHVGVAVRDIKSGEKVEGVYMDDEAKTVVEARSDIPLGHKIAVTDLAEGGDVIEYGARIGRVVQAIAKGDWVHTHNIKSARW